MDETEAPTLDRPDITGRLPRYRLLRQLAKTNMSEVFEAYDLVAQRPVALKVVGPEFMAEPGFRRRFERETSIALALDHPHIVASYDAGFSADGHLGYLAMQFVLGTNLARLIHRRGALSFEQTVAIGRGVGAALDAAHARNLVHRDVKPGNILLEDATGGVYLCDFGIARNLDLTRLTATGGFLGTMNYAAPEQREGRPVGAAADVYALACVLYECLSGSPPHHHADFAHPGVAALRRALDRDPAKRHRTCAELVDDLVATTEAAERARRRKRRWRVVGVPAAALVVVASLVLWFTTGGSPGTADSTLARVPTALRDGCAAANQPAAGATATLTCHDASGQAATTALYATPQQVTAAYADAVTRAGVDANQGDCAAATGGEHRYPATGPARGRVLCQDRDGTATVVWTDEKARTVNRAEAPDDAALRKAWAGWTGWAPAAFPTPDEKAVLDVAAGTACRRAAPADLDPYPGAVAGITCTPQGTGARQVSYFRFADVAALRSSFTGLVGAAKAPSGSGCPGGAFLGTTRFDWLSVDLGQVLCHPGPEGTVAMDWSLEAFSMIGHVTGSSPDVVGGWWSQWHLAPLSRIVSEVNSHTTPAFPTDAERSLLQHVPQQSRLNCVRPSADQKWQDLGAVNTVAAVACGRTSGAGLVVYYQLPDAATMRQVFNSTGDSDAACTSLPKDFSGDRPYSRGGRTGRLSCATEDPGGERVLKWTDDATTIETIAHRGNDPFALIDWWTHDAGPV
ncbi:serine/threonine-protein kinase [Amycolatopsis sp. DSM 110486]|uniref:serine/threonine-protein kinase n=1 Tax=Amycolatopsis sp. DSM 110486 TaxID=2865832 RepID=UPI001C6A548D|nr:serine/threonine-protein kinase [Amycolatopsis sp. DSM 110486]QYN19503.1 serine/threonine protein kinase [Amycolatopsis sp. DSM 110486]